MKTEFQILKARPKIQIVLTRDSVCAGDDCDAPHDKKVEVYSFVDPQSFARAISADYLPSIAGVGHSWTCVLNGVKVAEIKISVFDLWFEKIHFRKKIVFIFFIIRRHFDLEKDLKTLRLGVFVVKS